jgi:hypothetical protein
VAALQLEALGSGSIEPLKTGLKSQSAQVRFFSAEALAYLGDTSGVDVLGESAVRQPEFRAYALAALAVIDQPASHAKLRKLMDEPEIELRYGAFNALRTFDPHDPFLGRVRVLEEPKRDDEDEPIDSMAVAIASASRRARPVDPFALYVVDSEGPPLVHVSRTRRSEIVIFGRQQKLLPPIVLGTGSIWLNAAVNDDRIELSKIVPSQFGDADSKLTTTLDLAEVVRHAANLGASYPDIVTILETADRQKNLAGPLVVDAVPSSNRVYLEAILGRDTTAKRDDAVRRTSGDTSKPRWRRLFGWLSRDEDGTTPTNPAGAAAKDSTKVPDNNQGTGASPAMTPSGTSGSNPTSSDDAKKSVNPSGGPDAKKDDQIQKAAAETPAPQWRLLDLFRRSDES